MKFAATEIADVVVVEPSVFVDERGWFMESFSQPRFDAGLRDLGLPLPGSFVQDNHSCSKAGVLRGLHYQLPPRAQGKLVRVVRGAAYDVAVDIRRRSPTFGRWVGIELSEANRKQLWIPAGFAHGFLALEDDTQSLYKVTDTHARDRERSIAWNDAAIGIAWPLPAGVDLPLISTKDAAAPRLADAECFGD